MDAFLSCVQWLVSTIEQFFTQCMQLIEFTKCGRKHWKVVWCCWDGCKWLGDKKVVVSNGNYKKITNLVHHEIKVRWGCRHSIRRGTWFIMWNVGKGTCYWQGGKRLAHTNVWFGFPTVIIKKAYILFSLPNICFATFFQPTYGFQRCGRKEVLEKGLDKPHGSKTIHCHAICKGFRH